MVFFNHATRQMTAKIVYYGPGLCGKTTNLNIIYARTAQKARGEMVSLNTETDRTLFFDLLPLEVGMVGGFKAKLQLYTVPGQVFYNSTRKLVLKGVDGIVFVVDSQVPMLDANRESYQNLRNNLKELGLQLDDIPTVFQWNKRDLKNVVPVDVLEAELNPRGCPSYQSVAQGGEGVFETLRGITRLALAQIKALHLGEAPAKDEPMHELAPEPEFTPPPIPTPTLTLPPHPGPELGSDASLDDLFGAPPDFSGGEAGNAVADPFAGEPVTSGTDALSFLDLPTATDLFGAPAAWEVDGPSAPAPFLGDGQPTVGQQPAVAEGAPPVWQQPAVAEGAPPAWQQPAVAEGAPPAWQDASPLASGAPAWRDPSLAEREPPSGHDGASATPLFLGDLEVPGFRFDDFLTAEGTDGSPLPPGEDGGAGFKAAEGLGQVMAPLTVRLRAPLAKVTGSAPALVKPMAVLRPSAPMVVPRTQAAPVRALPPVPNLPNASRHAHLLRVLLPEHLAGDELEVVVLVRQNGMTIAEGHAQRAVPQAGGSATLNLELRRS